MLVCGSISSRAGRHLSGRLHGRLAAPAADPAASARSPRSSRHARPSASADALCAVWRLSWALKRWQSRGPSVGERASPILMPASARGARAGCVNRRRSSAGSQCATVRRWTGPRRIRRGLRRRYGRQALRTAICTARILGMLPGHRLHQVLSPTVGISEGPTTGTAAGPLVAALVASGRAADNITVVVEQGYCAGAAQQDSGPGCPPDFHEEFLRELERLQHCRDDAPRAELSGRPTTGRGRARTRRQESACAGSPDPHWNGARR